MILSMIKLILISIVSFYFEGILKINGPLCLITIFALMGILLGVKNRSTLYSLLTVAIVSIHIINHNLNNILYEVIK